MDGISKLKAGDFNEMSQDWQADGTVIITLSKRGERRIYKLCVQDLYGEHEEVLSEEVIEA